MFPRPGVVAFDIRKNEDGKGKTIIDNQIMIRRDLLPEISTARHVHGTITVEFFETDPERVEYTQNVEQIEYLKQNLEVFPADTAQVLEYWLDCSLFSDWKRPPAKIPWSTDVFLSDLATYRSFGICQITSFAVFVDAQYIATHGKPPLKEYGAGLQGTLKTP